MSERMPKYIGVRAKNQESAGGGIEYIGGGGIYGGDGGQGETEEMSLRTALKIAEEENKRLCEILEHIKAECVTAIDNSDKKMYWHIIDDIDKALKGGDPK